jgi:hypothetical protein
VEVPLDFPFKNSLEFSGRSAARPWEAPLKNPRRFRLRAQGCSVGRPEVAGRVILTRAREPFPWRFQRLLDFVQLKIP